MIDAVTSQIKALYPRTRTMPLKVSAPFHSSLLRSAATAFRPFLHNRAIWNKEKLSTPIISNVTAEPVESVDEIIDLLERQIYMPVRWFESVSRSCQMLHDAVQQQRQTHNVESLLLEISPRPVLLPLLQRMKHIPPHFLPQRFHVITNPEQLDSIPTTQ